MRYVQIFAMVLALFVGSNAQAVEMKLTIYG
jgi:hypothetical protein